MPTEPEMPEISHGEPTLREAWRARKILIVADHASARFGGEAALPLHYFRVMRKMGIDVRMITHDRVEKELREVLAGDFERLVFIKDNLAHILLWRMGQLLPARISYFTTGFVSRTITQWAQRRLARRLVREHGVDVVLQPMPVSPREPSLMYDVGAPVVIGPLNGNMQYPPGFKGTSSVVKTRIEGAARAFGEMLNTIFPGKRRAAAILVANERTRAALPRNLLGRVFLLPENGVDLSVWEKPRPDGESPADEATHFVFMGRLVDWKAVDLLLHAFDRARIQHPMRLTILGDGPCGPTLRTLATELDIIGIELGEVGRVHFAGWQSQLECARQLRGSHALVLPSLSECGGAVVLEAMACGLPVIATAWGGPLDYLDDRTGVLVLPTSREALISGVADAMVRLAASPARRREMGEAARRRIEADFDWDKKVDAMLSIFEAVCRN